MENIKKRKLIDGRMALLVLGQFVVVVLVSIMLINSSGKSDNGSKLERLRGVAIKLQEAGLMKDSISAYEDYFFALTDNIEAAKISYLIASLYKELNNKTAAVRWYYQTMESGLNITEVDESKKEVVVLLEGLRKFSAAKSVLNEATSLNKTKPKTSGTVIATVDGTNIYLSSIDKALDNYPSEIRKKFSTGKGKQGFASQFIGRELLYKRGERLGLDISNDIIENVAQMKKEFVIKKVLEQEFKDKIKISPDDLQNYFKANISQYKDKKAKKDPLFKDVKARVQNDYGKSKQEVVYQALLQELFKTSKVELHLERVK